MTLRARCWTSIFALALCVPAAWSQQNGPQVDPPVGQGGSNAPALRPDTRPFSGAEQITLGSVEGARSYLLPSFSFSQVADTNGRLGPGTSPRFETASIALAHLSLNYVGSRQQFAADYVGGGFLYETQSALNSNFQQFSLEDTLQTRRWKLVASDRFNYLQEAAFGLGGFGLGDTGATLGLGSALGQLNPAFVPSQTILTSRLGRYSNTALAEASYAAGPRSTITAVGAFETLNSRQQGFVSGNDLVFLAGYDRALTERDTLSLNYSLSEFRFNGVQQSIDNHIIQLGYGRRITGRLALKLVAGPQITLLRFQGRTSNPRVFLGAQGYLQYRFRKAELNLIYEQYITGGSGVFAGARTNAIQGSISRPLGRVWSGSLNSGYSRNAVLQQFPLGPPNHLFSYEFAGFNLSRPFGHYMQAYFIYNLQRQTSDTFFFNGASSSRILVRHVFGFGFSVHSRPIRI